MVNLAIDNINLILLALSLIYIWHLIRKINKEKELKNYYEESWSKWEREYWNLRTSDAVDSEKYSIHISWLTYGDDNIKLKLVVNNK